MSATSGRASKSGIGDDALEQEHETETELISGMAGPECVSHDQTPEAEPVVIDPSDDGRSSEGSSTLTHSGIPTDTAQAEPEEPYSVFSKATKLTIVALCGAAGTCSPISSTIFVPAIPTMAREFNKSEQDMSLAVTVYLVFQAITPSFFGTLSDTIGRRPVYIVTLIIYFGANIGLALTPTNAYWLLLVLRMVQVGRIATRSSQIELTIGNGRYLYGGYRERMRSRYSTVQGERQIYVVFSSRSHGWPSDRPITRRCFLAVRLAVDVLVLGNCHGDHADTTHSVRLALPRYDQKLTTRFVPETMRGLVGNGSIPPPPMNMTPGMFIKHMKEKRRREAAGEEMPIIERGPQKAVSNSVVILSQTHDLTPVQSRCTIFDSLQSGDHYIICRCSVCQPGVLLSLVSQYLCKTNAVNSHQDSVFDCFEGQIWSQRYQDRIGISVSLASLCAPVQ